jgi:RNA polymerase sigma factor (sigma-70 family)
MHVNDGQDGLSARRLHPDDFPMSQVQSFADFLHRIRRGDEQAAIELVERYEPLIRREVRLGINDSRLNRAFDSIDVCQSVLASFFARAATGQYDLESPEQLVKLLMSMARNKLASLARREHRLRRDARRVAATQPEVLEQVVDTAISPSETILRRELVERMRAELSDDERQIADLRVEGLGWDEVAERLGGTAQARRMQLARGVERAAEHLGLEE